LSRLVRKAIGTSVSDTTDGDQDLVVAKGVDGDNSRNKGLPDDIAMTEAGSSTAISAKTVSEMMVKSDLLATLSAPPAAA